MKPAITYVIPTLLEDPISFVDSVRSVQLLKIPANLIVVSPHPDSVRNYLAPLGFLQNTTILADQGRGVPNALKIALPHIKTRFWNWLGDDDYLNSQNLSDLLLSNALEQNEEFLLIGRCNYVTKSGILAVNAKPKLARKLIFIGPNLFAQPACIFPTLSSLKIGINSEYQYAFDQDLISNLLKDGNVKFLPTNQIIANYGWSTHTLTMRNRADSLRESFKIRIKIQETITSKVLVLILYPVTVILVKMSDSLFKLKNWILINVT